MAELVDPSEKYKASYIEAVREYQEEGLANYKDLKVEELEKNFASYVEMIRAEARGQGLKDGYVAHTVMWLVEGEKYLGRVDIRHTLNEFLQKMGGHIGYDVRPSERKKGYGKLALELGLKIAKNLGLKEILITCDVNNVGSRKIIERNGGVLENEKPMGEGEEDKARYWIKM